MSMAARKEIVQFDILECYKHESVQTKQDFNLLFSVVQDVLTHTTSFAEKCLLGNNVTITLDQSKPIPRLKCPLAILKRIHCTVACEANGEGEASASIGRILSSYSGGGRAVMTLAALALSYGELVFYVENRTHNLNPFASLISSLKRVDEIIRIKQENQFRAAIVELNKLTTMAVQLIGFILDLENLSKKDHYFIGNMSVVNEIKTIVQSYSLIAIDVVVTCMTQVNALTFDMIMTGKGLSSVVPVLDIAIKKLKVIIEEYNSQTEESEAYSELHICIGGGRGIVEVMTRMMYPVEPFLDCKNQKPVRVDQLLEGNSVLLFISELNISEDDYYILNMIHEKLVKERLNYKIVWIPVVRRRRDNKGKGWTPEELTKFNYCKGKMPWHVVNYEASKPIIGVRYIKEMWSFSYNPMVVVLNQNGAVECPDAMHIIRAWRTWPFPYGFNPRLHPDLGLFPIIFDIIKRKIEEEEYIFLYGGKDLKWITRFGSSVTKLVSANELVRAKISLTTFAVDEKNTNMEIAQFWTRIESMGCARMQWNMFDDSQIQITTQIQKLISLKEETGWAMLCKGPRPLVCASGTIIMDAVAEHRVWTSEIGKYSFETCLLKHLQRKQTAATGGGDKLPCCHVPFQGFSGWLPVDMECPDCGDRMERIVTYKCCHPSINK